MAVVFAVVMSVSSGVATYSILPIMQVALETDRIEDGDVDSQASGASPGSSGPMSLVTGTSGVVDLLDSGYRRIAGQDNQLARLVTLAIVAFSLVVLSHLTGGAMQMIYVTIQAGGVKRLRVDTFAHLNRLRMSYYDKSKSGIIIARVENDVGGTIAMVTGSISVFSMNVLVALVFGVLLFSTSTKLVLVAFPVILVAVLLSTYLASWMRRLRKLLQESGADIVAELQEYLAGVRVIKAFGREEHEGIKWERRVEWWRTLEIRHVLAKTLIPRGMGLAATMAVGTVFVYGSYLMINEQLGVGQLLLFAVLMQRLQSPGIALVGAYAETRSGMAYAERAFDMLDTGPQETSGSLDVQHVARRIAFDNVSFDYGEGPVLRRIDFQIPVGSMVALVGPSGVGKSTIADLMIRFYDPVYGNITLDDTDIREFDLKQYRALFGVVTQDTFLFHDTVRANIAYAIDDATEDAIIEAAKVANAHQFILELHQGYDTVIGDRGVRLSGGQRQRIAIARAVLRNPDVLILDEATSALDTEAERQVQQAIDRLIGDRMVLAIAHRLSTIQRADEIIVLDNGRILESGRHEELVARNGPYRRLYEMQFAKAGAAS